MSDLYAKYTEAIRATARRLLSEGTVDRVVGFEDSELPLRATILIARTPEEADRLVWHSGCGDNVATFLKVAAASRPHDADASRLGVVAKGCDARAIVGLIQEQQIKREDLFIIGVPCLGTIDFHNIERALDFEEMVSGDETDDQLTVHSRAAERTLDRDEALYAGCPTCEHPTPIIYDELVGEAIAARGDGIDSAAVERIEALPPDERWAGFERNLSGCIRCHACRDACPLCYCSVCFTERFTPQWLGTTPEPSDAQLYHLVRALHLAGRCVDCGACNRACPQGIDLRRLNKKLEREAREMFGHVSGVDSEALPVMATYDEKDPQDFMLEDTQ